MSTFKIRNGTYKKNHDELFSSRIYFKNYYKLAK